MAYRTTYDWFQTIHESFLSLHTDPRRFSPSTKWYSQNTTYSCMCLTLKCSRGDCTLTDHRSIFPVSTVVHSYSIVYAVRKSWFITKAVDIIQVDGEIPVGSIKGRARQGSSCTNKSYTESGVYTCAYIITFLQKQLVYNTAHIHGYKYDSFFYITHTVSPSCLQTT